MDKGLAMNVSDLMKQMIDKIQKIEPDYFQKIVGLVFFLCHAKEMMQCASDSDKLHTKITEIKEILCIPTTNADQDQLLKPESSKLPIQNSNSVGDALGQKQSHRFGANHERLSHSSIGTDHKIYITFHRESTFTELDVELYFSQFGTVSDVNIPSPDNRTFGFVTFSNPETVNSILSSSRTHYICDSKVIAKQYKHKSELEKEHAERAVNSALNDPHHLELINKLPPDDIFHKG